jgi:predicted nucleic acid-binding protein
VHAGWLGSAVPSPTWPTFHAAEARLSKAPMILPDTSVWIDHLRKPNAQLQELLEQNLVLTHPWVIGELACGHFANRVVTLTLLRELPRVPLVSDNDALYLLDSHRLMGRGIGYVDLHLLASVAVSDEALWTRDKRIAAIAEKLGLLHRPSSEGEMDSIN